MDTTSSAPMAGSACTSVSCCPKPEFDGSSESYDYPASDLTHDTLHIPATYLTVH